MINVSDTPHLPVSATPRGTSVASDVELLNQDEPFFAMLLLEFADPPGDVQAPLFSNDSLCP
jgi:hypothetical protein